MAGGPPKSGWEEVVLKGVIGEEVVLQRVFGGRWSSKAWLGGSGPQMNDWGGGGPPPKSGLGGGGDPKSGREGGSGSPKRDRSEVVLRIVGGGRGEGREVVLGVRWSSKE